MTKQPSTHHNRPNGKHRFQFSLKSLFFAVLVLCVVLGVYRQSIIAGVFLTALLTLAVLEDLWSGAAAVVIGVLVIVLVIGLIILILGL